MAVTLAGSALVAAGAQPAAAATLPCDIYAAGGTPCVSAYSTVRALYASYNGPLYQVQRASDSSFLNVGLLSAGGYANAAAQVSFCAGATCTITRVTAGGHQVFGDKVTPGAGYRIDTANGVPTGSQPEGVYMVTSDSLFNSNCCFDFSGGETSHTDAVQANINSAGYSAPSGGASGPIVAGDNGARCIDNNNGAATGGNKVQMWDGNGFAPAQSWRVASNGTLTIDGGCMDITGASSANGTLIEWWSCNGGANQQWHLP
jgi:hypothetical protein